MKYLYYIIGIVVAFSGLAVYGLVNTRVEISKPALVINDRIMTQAELETLMKTRPYYMNRDKYIDSIITRQLLIQEAVRQKINKEEPFRESIENYYEQSLIKILLDRQLKSIHVEVTADEIDRYQQRLNSRVKISKFGYKTVADARAGGGEAQVSESDFMDLSDDLKFIVFKLEPGQVSQPVVSGMGVLTYRLDQVMALKKESVVQSDLKRVSDFIRDRKKEVLMDEWTRSLKKNAKIWRKNES